MQQQTLEYLQHLINNDMQQSGAMINNGHNHNEQTREYWKSCEAIALQAMTDLLHIAIQ
jgi:hypothetical protein